MGLGPDFLLAGRGPSDEHAGPSLQIRKSPVWVPDGPALCSKHPPALRPGEWHDGLAKASFN